MQSSQFSVQHSLHLVTRLIENMNVIKVIQILLSEEIFGACRAVPKNSGLKLRTTLSPTL